MYVCVGRAGRDIVRAGVGFTWRRFYDLSGSLSSSLPFPGLCSSSSSGQLGARRGIVKLALPWRSPPKRSSDSIWPPGEKVTETASSATADRERTNRSVGNVKPV